MRPSTQWPTVLGTEIKLGLTMASYGLQSVLEPHNAPEPVGRHAKVVSKHVRKISVTFLTVCPSRRFPAL